MLASKIQCFCVRKITPEGGAVGLPCGESRLRRATLKVYGRRAVSERVHRAGKVGFRKPDNSGTSAAPVDEATRRAPEGPARPGP